MKLEIDSSSSIIGKTKGVPIQAIADILGHSSIDVTAIYARIVDHRKYTPGDILQQHIREALAEYQVHKEHILPALAAYAA